MYISQKQLLKSSTRSDRWLNSTSSPGRVKLDLKKEKSKYITWRTTRSVRKLRPTIPTTYHTSNNWWNWFSLTCVGLPLLHKISVRGIDVYFHFLNGPTKGNGLLRWEYRLKGFFEKTGRGWSRDAVTNNFLHEIERFLGYDWPWNYLTSL